MSDTTTKIENSPRIQSKLKIKEPNNYNVIYVNDEVTTMEFVIESLKNIFNYTEESATELCLQIHADGSSIVATLPYEIAEQKGVEVTILARNHGFPLQVKIEQE